MENSTSHRDESSASKNSCKRIVQNVVFNVVLGIIFFAAGIVVVGLSLAFPDQNKLLAVGSILLAAGIVLVVRGFLLKATQRYNLRRRRRRRRRRQQRSQQNACNSDGSDAEVGDPPPYEEAANDSSDSGSIDNGDYLNPPPYEEAIVLDINQDGTNSSERLTHNMHS